MRTKLFIIVFVFIALGVAIFAGMGSREILDSRSDEGQIASLTETFELEQCAELEVVGAMYRDSGKEFTHRTAFVAQPSCLSELKTQLFDAGYTADESGTFVSVPKDGYQERLIFSENGLFEWEREQK